MSTPFLVTKLHIPPTWPDLVPRPRLLARLNEGLLAELTLISAPAGFGKTTLVSNWLAQNERPAVWLSPDETDNDFVRFLTYLVAALPQSDPDHRCCKHPRIATSSIIYWKRCSSANSNRSRIFCCNPPSWINLVGCYAKPLPIRRMVRRLSNRWKRRTCS